MRRLCRLSGDEARRRFDGYWAQKHGDKPVRAARWLLGNNGWLTLSGSVGTGKTFLLQAIVNEAVEAGRMAIYLTMADLLEHLRRAYKPGVEVDSDALFDNIVRCEMLCVDEADKYNPTSWAEEKLMQLVDDRYRRWRECATVWAVNDVADVPGYLKSRMLDGRFVFLALKHQDVRPEVRRSS